ncbi:MAG: hypothetical protein A3F84_20845 [Candidatus Handelsmanbacteria bacterium RIFCSPLOWO2_12_FULL_64_10]|uniref:non-specific serine/threonine protein kinase n=1 Tax=Handelsmanbacteria sp. (strain RIFCSPLOWO2_12_FULL_64_10) TaxID=1817868 RepID=A0A1F6D4M5_HANXR|nr:MAG: hypothetical protein A3F84_20845 [Candidatus Handelsmanbacteria bacterium RIFCSPLOWO2_12_FULL_64_10]
MSLTSLESWLDSPARPELLGERWEIDYERRLGAGAHSEWFEAEDGRLGDAQEDRPLRAAAQLVRPDAPVEVIERLAAAGWLTAAVQHPRVIRTLDRGRESTAAGELYWSITELVEHPTLEAWVHDVAKGETRDALLIVQLIAQTLAEIRERFFPRSPGQALHRDLSPGNIYIVCDRLPGGGYGPVLDIRIGDWTFALQPRNRELTEIRANAISVGTAGYRAPEVALKQPPTDVSDIYSMAALAYRALTLTDPDDMRAPTELPADVPKPARDYLLRMLAQRPEERVGYARPAGDGQEQELSKRPSAEALVAADVRRLIDDLYGPSAAAPRMRAPWGLAAAVVLAAGIAGTCWYSASHPGKIPALDRLWGVRTSAAGEPAGTNDRGSGGPSPDTTPESGPDIHAGPKFIAPTAESADWSRMVDELYRDARPASQRFDFGPLIEALEREGHEGPADSMRAAVAAWNTGSGQWKTGTPSPAARFPKGELTRIETVTDDSVRGTASSGQTVTVALSDLDAVPIFAALAPKDQVRAIWASRDALTAATLAAREGIVVDEGWWLVSRALGEAQTRLEAVESYVLGEIRRERPKRETPIAPPIVGHDLPPRAEPLEIRIPEEAIRERLGAVAQLVEALGQAGWWEAIVTVDGALERERARLAGEVAAWALFGKRDDEALARDHAAAAAFGACVERTTIERLYGSRNLLEMENIKRWTYGQEGDTAAPPTIERKPRGQGDEALLHAAAGAIELAPEHYQSRPHVGYVRVRATLKRTAERASLWFLLGQDSADGERVEISCAASAGGQVTLWSEGAPRADVEDLFDPDRVIEHTFELVAIGRTAVVRVDGVIRYVTEWKDKGATWPRVGFQGVDGIVSEIRQWEEPTQ